VRGRAEALHGERTFTVVTSRAVAPLDRLLGWSMPLVAGSGALVAMKGSSIHEEIAAAAPVLQRLDCAPPEVHMLGAGRIASPTTAVRVAWADPARVGWRLPAKPTTRSGRRRGR
jgi:16S rRNA (guanine527-N7)-methyltransferase